MLFQISFCFILVSLTLNSASKLETVEQINALQTTWKAEISRKFFTATSGDIKKLLGTIMPGEEHYMEPEMEKMKFLTSSDTPLPESFDGRKAWPQCADIIGHVRDQSSCGSCWAFGSTEAFNDRHCIATGDTKTLLSPEDTVSCCNGIHCNFSFGCDGGQPSGAWNWFLRTGVSTGGDYNDKNTGDSCKPYSFQSCAHHVNPPAGIVGCDTLPMFATPKCTTTCSDTGYGTAYKTDKQRARSSYSIKTEENIKRELMEHGSITVAFTVYEDFELYKEGVYQHVTGAPLGGHAVKMIGWGVEDYNNNLIPYWICVNSWNNLWGEGGTFRILRGSNECGIESSCVAGEAGEAQSSNSFNLRKMGLGVDN